MYEGSFNGLHTAFFICIALLGINILNAVFVVVQHAYNVSAGQTSNRNSVMLRLLRFNSTLLIGPLYIPVRLDICVSVCFTILSFFIGFGDSIQCVVDDKSNATLDSQMIGTFMLQIMNPPAGGSFSGGSAQHIIYAVFGALMICLLFGYTFFLASTWFSRLPTDEGLLSRPSSLVAVALLITKTVVPIVFIGVHWIEGWSHWVMIAICIFCYFGLLFIITWVRHIDRSLFALSLCRFPHSPCPCAHVSLSLCFVRSTNRTTATSTTLCKVRSSASAPGLRSWAR